jgi:hypothetical protein
MLYFPLDDLHFGVFGLLLNLVIHQGRPFFILPQTDADFLLGRLGPTKYANCQPEEIRLENMFRTSL